MPRHACSHGLGSGTCASTAGVGRSSEIPLERAVRNSLRTDRCRVLSGNYEDFWAERAESQPLEAAIQTTCRAPSPASEGGQARRITGCQIPHGARKLLAIFCSRLIVEHHSTMGSPMHYMESDRQPKALKLAAQLMRLDDRSSAGLDLHAARAKAGPTCRHERLGLPTSPAPANPLLGRPGFQGAGRSLAIRVSRIRIVPGVPTHALGEHGPAQAGVAAGNALCRTGVADRSGVGLGVAVLGWSDRAGQTRASLAADLSARAVLDWGFRLFGTPRPKRHPTEGAADAEENIPAEPAQESQDARVPHSDEDSGRPTCAQSSPRQGAQAPHRQRRETRNSHLI